MQGAPINIDDLVHARSVEDNRREFKATWDDSVKEAVVRTVCAFGNDLLNLNGGYVILGIDTDELGNPILPPRGLVDQDIDLIQREILGQCNRIEPAYQPLTFPETYHDKSILIVWAPGGDNRPYQAPRRRQEGDRAYFVRQGSSTVEATGQTRTQLLDQAARIPFDDRRSLVSTVENISPTLVRRFLSDVRSDLVRTGTNVADIDLYERMRLVLRLNAHYAPRNTAILFFNETPDSFFPGARIEVVQFGDDAGGDLIEERTISGPLNEQIKLAVDHLNSLADAMLRKRQGEAEVDRTVAYPYEAMEEAVVNAVYHRSYDNHPEPSKIYLYPDRMEIISYPGPLPGIEKHHLASDGRVPPIPARNRRIGGFLKELRLAEGRGTGLPKIRRRMEENGSPEPQFDYDEDRSYFRVTLPAHPRYKVIHALRESALLWSTGERQSAIAHLRRVFEAQPGSGALASRLIDYLTATDDLTSAEHTLDQFVSHPAKTEAAQPYLVYAKALLDRNQPAKARQVLDSMPSSGPAEDILETAILRKRSRDHRTAHTLFSQIYPEMMDEPKLLAEFAQTKMSLAGDLYRSSRRNPGRNAPTRKRLNREAVELLRRAIQLTDDTTRESWCWYDLATALKWSGEPNTEVEKAFLNALSLRPEEPHFNRGYEEWKRSSR